MSDAPAALPSNPSNASMTKGATFAVGVLTFINLLNYVDRYVPSAVKDLFKKDLNLTDTQTSLPLSAFIVVYMLASPLIGGWAERGPRKIIIAAGVALWSLATAGAALATNFTMFLLARAAVGIGEAAYATISPTLIADFYPSTKRNKIFTVFYVAIPVGSALGFVIGGALGEHFGWRSAFLICGLPGILVALLALTIRDPPRGQFDDAATRGLPVPTWPEALRALWKNKRYMYAVAGYVAVTFATGGLADWFPTYLSRVRGMNLEEAGGTVGTVTVVGGLVGTILGGVLADKLKGKTKQPYLALSAVTMLPAIGLAFAAFYVFDSKPLIFGSILLCQICLWCYNGPINAILVNSVDAGMRARAFAVSILSIHILGDVISPPIIGAISDATGSLRLAVGIVPIAIAVSCAIWMIGWRTLPPDADETEVAAA